MTSTIVQQENSEGTGFDLDAAVAEAVAAHEAFAAAQHRAKEEERARQVGLIRQRFMEKIAPVLRPELIAALGLGNFSPGGADFHRNGISYHIWETVERGNTGKHAGWGICEFVPGGSRLAVTFATDAEFERTLLVYIGMRERAKAARQRQEQAE